MSVDHQPLFKHKFHQSKGIKELNKPDFVVNFNQLA